MKNKNVQIPEQLLIDLCNYHIAGIRDPNLDMRIRQGLQVKLNAVKRRSDYQKRVAHEKILRFLKTYYFPRSMLLGKTR